jgi:hypothetical protein
MSTYYVATAISVPPGIDTNPGTLAAPFLTIAYAKSKATSSDDVVYFRGGTWNEKLITSYDGTLGHEIQFRNYPGETVVLDGVGLASGTTAGVITSTGDYTIIDGFEIKNANGTGVNKLVDGIYNNGNHVTFKNLRIHDINWSAIHAYGNSLTLDHITAYDICRTGGNEGISLIGVDGFDIGYATIYRTDMLAVATIENGTGTLTAGPSITLGSGYTDIGITVAGTFIVTPLYTYVGGYAYSDGWVVTGSPVLMQRHDPITPYTITVEAGGAGNIRLWMQGKKEGIDCKSGTGTSIQNGVIHHCTIYDTATPIFINAGGLADVKNIKVYCNNVTSQNQDTGIGLSDEGDAGSLYSLTGIEIFNNICNGNSLGGGISMGWNTCKRCEVKIYSNTVIKVGITGISLSTEFTYGPCEVCNNIIVGDWAPATTYRLLYLSAAALLAAPVVTNNLFFSPAGSYNPLNNYGDNYIQADPLFQDYAGNDVHLQPASPAINAGNNRYADAHDYEGLPRIIGDIVDIGALEYRRGKTYIGSI